jgi:hypothetical protein
VHLRGRVAEAALKWRSETLVRIWKVAISLAVGSNLVTAFDGFLATPNVAYFHPLSASERKPI